MTHLPAIAVRFSGATDYHAIYRARHRDIKDISTNDSAEVTMRTRLRGANCTLSSPHCRCRLPIFFR
jgi:hypothetical protein